MDFSHLLKFFEEKYLDLKDYYNYETFEWACENGHINIAKWLYLKCCPDNFTHDAFDSFPFRTSCEHGQLEVAKWLYSLDPIEAEEAEEDAFYESCVSGQLEVAKWLYSLRELKIRHSDDQIFSVVCAHNITNMAIWMSENFDDRYSFKLDRINNNLIPVIQKLDYLFCEENKEKEDCCICYNTSNVRTSCGHYGCEECFVQWNRSSCPYCRQEINYYVKLI